VYTYFIEVLSCHDKNTMLTINQGFFSLQTS